VHIHIIDGEYELIWASAKSGKYSPKDRYLVLVKPRKPQAIQAWWKHIWMLKVPPKSRLLMWCILTNKISTGNNLMKCSFHRPHWCYLCNSDNESAFHLFLTCTEARKLWDLVLAVVSLPCNWLVDSLIEALNS